MKKLLIAALSATLAFLSAPASADNHEEPRDWFPMEIFACNLNDGKTMADFNAATEAWSEWADERDIDSYWAGVLLPYYYGPAQGNFDVAWLGAWNSGASMGAGTDAWLSEGGEIGAQFAAAATCEAHGGFAVTNIYEGNGLDDDGGIVMAFQDCTASGDIWPALDAWAEYAEEAGFEGGRWLLSPVYGDGSAEFDFKIVTVNHDFTEVGTDWDLWAQHYRKWAELSGETLSCDEARVYATSVIRRITADVDEE